MLPFPVFLDQNSRRPVRFISSVVVHPLPPPQARSSTTLSSLSFHTLTNCKFCNSFVLIFIQNAGGSRVGVLRFFDLRTFRPSDVPTFRRSNDSSIYFLSFHTLA